jgi:Domain of unknown function (DUF4388)
MALVSSLKDLPLAELFQLIEHGRKTCCLRVSTSPDSLASEAKTYHYYAWFRQGRFVAAANRLDGQNLVSEVISRGWLSQRVVERLSTRCPANVPLGVYLKMNGALQPDQVHTLFSTQLRQALALFEIQVGEFRLETNVPLPWSEMAGLSLPSIEVALGALRLPNSWQALADALPEPSSAIQSRGSIQPQCSLNALDWQVWEFSKGTVALRNIAIQLNQPVEVVQQAAFRLMLAGLAEEIFVPLPTPTQTTHPTKLVEENQISESNESDKAQVSSSFLQSLVRFLRSQV